MNDIELKQLLDSYNHRLEEAKLLNLQSWVLNLQCFEELLKQKSRNKLKSLFNFKLSAITLGILWIFFLVFLLINSLEIKKIFFVISVAAILFFNMYAVAIYWYHLILIRKINNSETVIETQEKISRLKVSTLNSARILFLQMPFYCTFWWSMEFINSSPLSFWCISVPIALLFTGFSVWLFRNISIKNAGKKWFKFLFNSPEWNWLISANNFLNEIEAFKKDKI